MSYTTLHLSD